MSEFNIHEIKEAKYILCDVAKGSYQKRRSTDTRSEKTPHLVDICEIIRKLDDNNMPLFVMDSISFARRLPVNAEDVSYIAIASKLDTMNTLISENKMLLEASHMKNECNIWHVTMQI